MPPEIGDNRRESWALFVTPKDKQADERIPTCATDRIRPFRCEELEVQIPLNITRLDPQPALDEWLDLRSGWPEFLGSDSMPADRSKKSWMLAW